MQLLLKVRVRALLGYMHSTLSLWGIERVIVHLVVFIVVHDKKCKDIVVSPEQLHGTLAPNQRVIKDLSELESLWYGHQLLYFVLDFCQSWTIFFMKSERK